MNYILFDLEATCAPEHEKKFKSETIEIGAVKINDGLEVLGEFDRFIKPTKSPILTDFCTKLTTIQQSDIDNAKTFPEVIKEFKSWVGVERDSYVLLSWGNYDKKQFVSDCQLHNLPYSWAMNHLNFKSIFAMRKNVEKCGMAKALEIMGLTLDGTHHRGIDDARNIGKIFIEGYNLWKIK